MAMADLLERYAHDRLFKFFFELLYRGRKIDFLLGHPKSLGYVLLLRIQHLSLCPAQLLAALEVKHGRAVGDSHCLGQVAPARIVERGVVIRIILLMGVERGHLLFLDVLYGLDLDVFLDYRVFGGRRGTLLVVPLYDALFVWTDLDGLESRVASEGLIQGGAIRC
jgi:hypothetical protein